MSLKPISGQEAVNGDMMRQQRHKLEKDDFFGSRYMTDSPQA